MAGILEFDILQWCKRELDLRWRSAALRGRQGTRAAGAHRVAFTGSVIIRQGTHTVRATSGDLSVLGAYIHTTNPPGVGCDVLLTIRLSALLTIATTARVRWMDIDDNCRPTGCGVSFASLSDETRDAVQRVLDEAEARPVGRKAQLRRDPRTDLLWRTHGLLDRIAG